MCWKIFIFIEWGAVRRWKFKWEFPYDTVRLKNQTWIEELELRFMVEKAIEKSHILLVAVYSFALTDFWFILEVKRWNSERRAEGLARRPVGKSQLVRTSPIRAKGRKSQKERLWQGGRQRQQKRNRKTAKRKTHINKNLYRGNLLKPPLSNCRLYRLSTGLEGGDEKYRQVL